MLCHELKVSHRLEQGCSSLSIDIQSSSMKASSWPTCMPLTIDPLLLDHLMTSWPFQRVRQELLKCILNLFKAVTLKISPTMTQEHEYSLSQNDRPCFSSLFLKAASFHSCPSCCLAIYQSVGSSSSISLSGGAIHVYSKVHM